MQAVSLCPINNANKENFYDGVQKSAEYMKNAKRRRLSPEDFNQALRDSNIEASKIS